MRMLVCYDVAHSVEQELHQVNSFIDVEKNIVFSLRTLFMAF